MNISKNGIALAVALLFHSCGFIGIVFSPYKQWFVDNTSVNLFLMASLLIIVQEKKNLHFWLFVIGCVLTGMAVEWIGVHTGLLFGSYQYGEVLGYKWSGVPILIGINWFVILFCSANLVMQFQQFIIKKLGDQTTTLSSRLQKWSLITDTAILATFFDIIMEPVAVKLHFWTWDGNIPVSNYICWFMISCILSWLFSMLQFKKENQFAVPK